MSLAGVASAIEHFMNAGPGIFWSPVVVLLVAIPVTLLHELGHAVVAGARLGSGAHVTVGNAGRIGTVRFGRLTITLHALALPTRLGGAARLDARRATPHDLLWISLGGPAASLAGGLLADIAYRHAPATGVVHALLWAAVFGSVCGVANLIPLRLQERRGGPAFNTDGMTALSALVLILRGRSPLTGPPVRPFARPAAAAAGDGLPERADIGVRVWRHHDHLHVGVGTKHAFETQTAAVTTISPSTGRDMARAILELADEAQHASPARPVAAQVEQRTTDVLKSSVPPPGYTH